MDIDLKMQFDLINIPSKIENINILISDSLKTILMIFNFYFKMIA